MPQHERWPDSKLFWVKQRFRAKRNLWVLGATLGTEQTKILKKWHWPWPLNGGVSCEKRLLADWEH